MLYVIFYKHSPEADFVNGFRMIKCEKNTIKLRKVSIPLLEFIVVCGYKISYYDMNLKYYFPS